MIIIRDGIRDGSLRYRLTYAQETLSRVGGWLKAERLRFPLVVTNGEQRCIVLSLLQERLRDAPDFMCPDARR